jgi:hypothetical protein
VPIYSRFLSCLGCSCQFSRKYYVPHRMLFHFLSPYRPATWAGGRAGSPVSVSLVGFSGLIRSRKPVITYFNYIPSFLLQRCPTNF